MSLGRFDWGIVAGDDEAVIFTFADLDYDATRTWTAQVRRQPGQTGTPAAACGVVPSSTADGKQVVTVALTDTQTRVLGDLHLTCLYWDLQMVEGAITSTIIKGAVEVEQDVTL